MTTAAEGIQIPINAASKAQLRAFLTHLGGAWTNFDNEAKLIAKIQAQDYDSAHILAFDGSDAPKASSLVRAAAAPKGEMQEPTCDLIIHQSEGPGGKRAVFVGVNGKAMLIPRGKESKNVKIRYLDALEIAVETKYEYDEDAKANLPRDMPSYSFQVTRYADPTLVKRWHAYVAEQEAIAEASVAKKRAA